MDRSHPRGVVSRVGDRGSSNTCADCRRMNPQFAQVSGKASVPRFTELLPTTCWRAIRSSHPCHCSCPQNGHAFRALRLRRKSKMPFIAQPRAKSKLRFIVLSLLHCGRSGVRVSGLRPGRCSHLLRPREQQPGIHYSRSTHHATNNSFPGDCRATQERRIGEAAAERSGRVEPAVPAFACHSRRTDEGPD